MKTKHILLALLLLFGVMVNNFVGASQSRENHLLNIINEISAVADEFNLTEEQKSQMKYILINYLPEMALKANAMMNNRQELLESSLGEDNTDEELLSEIANKQGQLLSSIIISKEHMKKDLRNILNEDQKDFLDSLLETLIQFKLNQI